MEYISIDKGVFPVPPKYIFPTQITGIEHWFFLVRKVFRRVNNFIIKVFINKILKHIQKPAQKRKQY